MTSDFFNKAMARLCSFYNNKGLLDDEDQMEVWYSFLMFYSDEQIAAAILHMMDTVPAFPSIQMVTSYIKKMNEVPWEAAFTEAKSKAHLLKYPQYVNGEKMPVNFSDSLVLDVINVIGLNEFVSCHVSDSGTLRAQFKSAYESMQSRRNMEKIAAFATIGTQSPVMMLVTGDIYQLTKVAALMAANNG